MHMADALLHPAVAGTMYGATGAALVYSIATLKKDDQEPAKLPTMAVASALVFAGQMINYTIPGTGSSGHICGGFLLAALLGPRAAFMCMSVILGIQCFFFADGGILALGANISAPTSDSSFFMIRLIPWPEINILSAALCMLFSSQTARKHSSSFVFMVFLRIFVTLMVHNFLFIRNPIRGIYTYVLRCAFIKKQTLLNIPKMSVKKIIKIFDHAIFFIVCALCM